MFPSRLLGSVLAFIQLGFGGLSTADARTAGTAGTPLHVPADFPSIQAAILAASGGDEVLVAPGTYAENISFLGKAITVRSTGGAAVTTIDGSLQTAGSDSGSVVRFLAGEPESSILEGFTLMSGTGTHRNLSGDDFRIGGAVFCLASSPTIRNCVLTGNTLPGVLTAGGGLGCLEGASPLVSGVTITSNVALAGGGVICFSGSAPILENCVVSGNSALAGGGLQSSDSSPQITNCEFAGNHADDQGGGIRIRGSPSPFITQTGVRGNSSDGTGGGIDVNGSVLNVTASTISENRADQGGGIAAWGGASGSVTGCLIDTNTAVDPFNGGGGGVVCFSGAAPKFSDCTVIHNSGSQGRGSAFDISTDSNPEILRCTISDNLSRGPGGAAVWVFEATPLISRSIIAYSSGGKAIICDFGANPTVTCCDFFGNMEGDDLCGSVGVGNFSLDPKFCDRTMQDYTLQTSSPCVPGQHPGGESCEQIGAHPTICADVPTKVITWGRLKALRR